MGQTKGCKVRVAVVLLQEGRILMVRQNNKDFWVFPGGTLDPGESIEECGIREIKEEFNLDIKIDRLLYIADFMTPKRPTIDVFFLGHYLSGEMKLAEDENLNEAGFFTLDELKKLPVQPRMVSEQVQKDMLKQFDIPGGLYLGKYEKIVD